MSKFKNINAKLDWVVRQGFMKAFDFNSRATRMEFWLFNLFLYFLIHLAERFADPYFFPKNEWEPISLSLASLLLIPSLSIAARRLHDINRSAKWLFLIPTLIGIPILIYFYCTKGTEGKNKFGLPRVVCGKV